jgi:hypothetical protein
MLQFKDCSKTGTQQFFDDHDFAGMASSWVNTKVDGRVMVWDGKGRTLWTEDAETLSSVVADSKKPLSYAFTCRTF